MSSEPVSVIHPTYRYLDRAPRLGGLTFAQWGQLVAAGVGAWLLAQLLPFSTAYNLSVALTISGTPVAASLATGADGIHPLAQIRALLAWQRRAAVYVPGVDPAAPPDGYRLIQEARPQANATAVWTSVEELWD